MYGLNESEDLSFMLGKELQQVAVGQFQVILHFLDDLSIYIGSGCKFIDKDEKSTEMSGDNPKSTKNLVCLLGQRIDKADNLGEGTLKLIFSDKSQLLLFDDLENYECYHITSPDGEILV